ncbi:hypothetical protein Tsubulata_007474 [Turnera subulata]|uniref:Uncharacterized protein n=1 Tax=Turnera subulata TaxID=218843 RepID=A0A9Q0J606_9ROSI|nr:hypothetical protein Tsubulata_007474 [Turnera subulata]
MSTTPLCMLVMYVLVLLCCLETTMGGRNIPSSVPSTQEQAEFVKMKPEMDLRRPVFGSRGVKSCLPKGFRHSSAPSRFVNYQPLGSCSKINVNHPDPKPKP